MYQTPEVQDLGTVRALTLGGGAGADDTVSLLDPDDTCYDVDPFSPNAQLCVSGS